jgi:hypothetical protein
MDMFWVDTHLKIHPLAPPHGKYLLFFCLDYGESTFPESKTKFCIITQTSITEKLEFDCFPLGTHPETPAVHGCPSKLPF